MEHESILSSRDKNDIFWTKKRRYMISSSVKCTTEDGFFSPDMAAEVKSIIAESSDAGISALIGREFMDTPPLASGLSTMARFMAEAKIFADKNNDPKSSLIDEILKHFYTACGVADDGGIIKDKKSAKTPNTFLI